MASSNQTFFFVMGMAAGVVGGVKSISLRIILEKADGFLDDVSTLCFRPAVTVW